MSARMEVACRDCKDDFIRTYFNERFCKGCKVKRAKKQKKDWRFV